MIEVELAFVAFMLLVIVWQVAGLQEYLFRTHIDLLRALLEDRQDLDAKRDAELMVRLARESVVIMDSVPRWRIRLLMLAGRI